MAEVGVGAGGLTGDNAPMNRPFPRARRIPLALLALCLAPLLAAALTAALCRAQDKPTAPALSAAPDKKAGVYAAGERITFQVEAPAAGGAAVKQTGYVLKNGGLTVVKEGTLDPSSGGATVETSLDEPGTV